jgi:DNA polymerase-3 subunit epsilon
MYLPNFLDGFDRLVAFDAETTGKRIPGRVYSKAAFCLESPRHHHRTRFRRNAARNPRAGVSARCGAPESTRMGQSTPGAIKIHGTRPADLKNAPRFPTILPRVKDFVGESPIVAHAYKNERDFTRL